MTKTKQVSKESVDDRRELDRRLRQYPDRPAYMAVRAAFIERFARLYGLLATAAKRFSGKRASEAAKYQKAVRAAEKLDSECSRLAALLFEDPLDPMPIRAARYDLRMGPRDWRDPSVVKFLGRVLRRWEQPRGRPPKLLPTALLALDLRLTDRRRWSWNALPAELCRCGAAANDHRFECRENIRREINNLRKYLTKMGVKLPSTGK